VEGEHETTSTSVRELPHDAESQVRSASAACSCRSSLAWSMLRHPTHDITSVP
jgi:hypothetical protein